MERLGRAVAAPRTGGGFSPELELFSDTVSAGGADPRLLRDALGIVFI